MAQSDDQESAALLVSDNLWVESTQVHTYPSQKHKRRQPDNCGTGGCDSVPQGDHDEMDLM